MYARFKQAPWGRAIDSLSGASAICKRKHLTLTGGRATESLLPPLTSGSVCLSQVSTSHLHPAPVDGGRDRMKCACRPCPQVGSATDGGWFGRGFYFTPNCDVSLSYARQNPGGGVMLIVKVLVGGVNTRGLHSSTSQLNLSRVWHKKTPYTPLHTPYYPLCTGYTTTTRTPLSHTKRQVELETGRV